MEHGAPSEILPVEVKLESPDVHLLDFDYFVAVYQLLSNFFVFWNLWLAQEGASISSYKIEFNEGTFRTSLCKFYY